MPPGDRHYAWRTPSQEEEAVGLPSNLLAIARGVPAAAPPSQFMLHPASTQLATTIATHLLGAPTFTFRSPTPLPPGSKNQPTMSLDNILMKIVDHNSLTKSEAKMAFDTFDTDRNGTISRSELEGALDKVCGVWVVCVCVLGGRELLLRLSGTVPDPVPFGDGWAPCESNVVRFTRALGHAPTHPPLMCAPSPPSGAAPRAAHCRPRLPLDVMSNTVISFPMHGCWAHNPK